MTKGIRRTRTAEGVRLFKELARFASQSVSVGYLDGELAQRAAYHEFGTREVPSRPFMTQAAERWVDDGILADAVDEIFAGRSADSALERAAVRAVGAVQEVITDGDFDVLDEATIERKGSSRPLIDTGAMRQGVTYEIGARGELDDELTGGG